MGFLKIQSGFQAHIDVNLLVGGRSQQNDNKQSLSIRRKRQTHRLQQHLAAAIFNF